MAGKTLVHVAQATGLSLAVLLVTVTGFMVLKPAPIVVEKVVNGDIVDVQRNGRIVRVRLLNIDAPEASRADMPGECLGDEAAEHLKTLLPKGTPVILLHGEEREDNRGRELAVIKANKKLINIEMARAGYGVPVLTEKNKRFYSRVVDGWTSAEHDKVGLWSETVPCTAVTQINEATQAYLKLPSQPADTSLDGLKNYHMTLSAGLEAYEKFGQTFAKNEAAIQFQALGSTRLSIEKNNYEKNRHHLQERVNNAAKVFLAEQQRLEQERKAAEAAAKRAEQEAQRNQTAPNSQAGGSPAKPKGNVPQAPGPKPQPVPNPDPDDDDDDNDDDDDDQRPR